MLYTTTRNDRDAVTAQRALTAHRGPDGGLFVPFRIPVFSREQLQALSEKPFNACLADILNLLFQSRITAYDIDCTLGRRCVRLSRLGQKILMAECWHNMHWRFSSMVEDLSELVLSSREAPASREGWAQIGVRIGVLFGIFGQLIREGDTDTGKPVDISFVAGDLSGPVSAWYAREMGLPIGNILCCCNENGALWDLFCHGYLRTDTVAVDTLVPEGDVAVPENLERLICSCGGSREVQRYLEALCRGGTYYPEEALLKKLRQGMYVTVSSQQRILQTIPSCFSTHGYLQSPASGLTYAGLQDYRARTGAMRTAVIWSDASPKLSGDIIAKALKIDRAELEKVF